MKPTLDKRGASQAGLPNCCLPGIARGSCEEDEEKSEKLYFLWENPKSKKSNEDFILCFDRGVAVDGHLSSSCSFHVHKLIWLLRWIRSRQKRSPEDVSS